MAVTAFSKHLNLNYNFALDNNLETFEYNSIGLNFNFEKITTNFDFIEENGKMGDSNALENTTTFNFDNEDFEFYSELPQDIEECISNIQE